MKSKRRIKNKKNKKMSPTIEKELNKLTKQWFQSKSKKKTINLFIKSIKQKCKLKHHG